MDQIYSVLAEAKAWADDLAVDSANNDVTRFLYEELLRVSDGIEHAEQIGADKIPAGYAYVVAAELPLPDREEGSGPGAPRMNARKEPYEDDKDCAIEELDLRPLKRGEFQEYRWKNGDDYDGVAGRVGVPPHLASTIRDYIKKIGIWDLMIDTILNDPMGQDTTRFYTVPSGDGKRNFTWSAKRPDNFYGSDVSLVLGRHAISGSRPHRRLRVSDIDRRASAVARRTGTHAENRRRRAWLGQFWLIVGYRRVLCIWFLLVKKQRLIQLRKGAYKIWPA